MIAPTGPQLVVFNLNPPRLLLFVRFLASSQATVALQEGIWAAKRILSSWSKQGRLLFYLDLHGHASKRGCFLYANRMAGPGQGWNSGFARLCQMNSPHFELEQCHLDSVELPSKRSLFDM